MIRDHARARMAFDHVDAVQAETSPLEVGDNKVRRRAYGAICHKLPILVHQAGLAPALHHVAALRRQGKSRIIDQLAEQLHEARLIRDGTGAALLRGTLTEDLGELQALTREAQRCLEWYKRFAVSVLKVETSDSDDTDNGEENRCE